MKSWKQLSDIPVPKQKIKNLLQKSDRYKIGSTGYDNYGHQVCRLINPHINLHPLHLYLNLVEILPNLTNPHLFNNIDCGFYNNEGKYEIGYIFPALLDLMEREQHIFIILDLNNYYVSQTKNKKTKRPKQINNYECHSVVLIFHHRENGIYDIFYINSHGKSITKEVTFQCILSKSRTKNYIFKKNIHYMLVKSFVTNLQNYIRTHYYNNPLKKIKLYYNQSNQHNYYGCNFQNGDFYGICYIFPLIFWYYFCTYYNKSRQNYPSVCEMLQNYQLDLFVKSCFLEFSVKFKNMILVNNDFSLNLFIEKKGTRLTKQILGRFIQFITQKQIASRVQRNF